MATEKRNTSDTSLRTVIDGRALAVKLLEGIGGEEREGRGEEGERKGEREEKEGKRREWKKEGKRGQQVNPKSYIVLGRPSPRPE